MHAAFRVIDIVGIGQNPFVKVVGVLDCDFYGDIADLFLDVNWCVLSLFIPVDLADVANYPALKKYW